MLGQENKGLLVILSNFNHERWVMCCGAARGARFIVEECFVSTRPDFPLTSSTLAC